MKETVRKIISEEGGLLHFLGPLRRDGLPLMKNVLTPLAKNVSISSGLTAAATTTGAAIQNKIYELGMTTIIISNKEMQDTL